jgi:hypothetical protein
MNGLWYALVERTRRPRREYTCSVPTVGQTHNFLMERTGSDSEFVPFTLLDSAKPGLEESGVLTWKGMDSQSRTNLPSKGQHEFRFEVGSDLGRIFLPVKKALIQTVKAALQLESSGEKPPSDL